MGGAGLLRPRPQPACLRPGRGRESGAFPRDRRAGLRALPGIGAYTAAAVASIAFGVPVVPVDGNVERVAARVFAISEPLPGARASIAAAAARRWASDPAARARPTGLHAGPVRPGSHHLHARVRRRARCAPGATRLRRPCRGRARTPAGEGSEAGCGPCATGRCSALEDAEARVLLRRRPGTGLLGGMLELPGTAWRDGPWSWRRRPWPWRRKQADWRLVGQATARVHPFRVAAGRVCGLCRASIEAEGVLQPLGGLSGAALPTVMRRCVRVAQEAGFLLGGSPAVKEPRP